MTVVMRRVWAWMLARPEPREPARRIVSLGSAAAAVAFLVVFGVATPSYRTIMGRLGWLLILALGASAGVLFVRAWRRGREDERTRS